MPSLVNFSYALDNFAFGIVYTDDSGADSSDYFYQLGNNYPVQFTVNFRGLGLPANLYSQFVTLFEFITSGDVECDNTVDGICTLPAPCMNYTALTDYYFLLNFTSNVDNGNYMRVPLAAFSEGVIVSGKTICHVNVNYLDTQATQSQNILMGGMYFTEFFGVFINDYHDLHNVEQGTQQYVGRNSIYNAYIGNEDLPQGLNPFVPKPPAPPADNGIGTAWIVVISIIGAALVAFLGYLLYKYKMATANKNVRGSNVVYGTNGAGKVNASDTVDIPNDEKKLLGEV